jgi:probable HAF family extracellular repeat protein
MRFAGKALLTVSLLAPFTLVITAGPSAAAAPPVTTYQLIDLGTLGGESSYATAINDRGHVVGSSQTAAGDWHGFLWRGGRMTDLGALRPTGINNRDEVIGTTDTATTGYLWRRGRLTDLGTLGGLSSFPAAINDRGDVVGSSSDETGRDVPFLWRRGTMRALPLTSVSGVNNRRQVSGGTLVPNGFHAAVWSRGRVTDLGAGPFNRSNTYGINDKGWVIGWQFSATQTERGVLWRRHRPIDIGTLGGDTTQLKAINDRGQILGVSETAAGAVHPFLWRKGVMTDLVALGVDPEHDIVGLNDRGEIVTSYRPVFGISHAAVYRSQRS